MGSKDSKGVMILTFDSKFDSQAGAGKGFSLKVDAVDRCKLLCEINPWSLYPTNIIKDPL